METKKIVIVVGTRPNFIKISQFKKAAKKYPDIEISIVHTGQHYDRNLSKVFFEQLGVMPDVFLDVDTESPVKQMAKSMVALEKIFSRVNPSLVIVPGDVNSTFIAAFTASRMNIPVAHIESGLRSFDRTMPEEFNRICTDYLADYLFVTEQSGMDNLICEGKNSNNIYFVGNTMIDTMVAFTKQIDQSLILKKYNLEIGCFVVLTMHRPSTVDTKDGLKQLLDIINLITSKYKLIFPVHPRTLKCFKKYNLLNGFNNNKKIITIEPLDYFAFQKLILNCKFIITDSGGIQEESTFRKVPCLTLRSNTERPVTVAIGTNTLVPFDLIILKDFIYAIENGTYKKGTIPPLWDGHSTGRIMEIINQIMK